VLKFIRETRLAAAGLTLAFLGGITLLEARGADPVAAGSLLTGLGLASIFPISVSLFPRWFRENAGRASGPVFAGGNMGGAILPWLVGVISTQFGSLRSGFFVPVAAVLLMLAFYIAEGFIGRGANAEVAQFVGSE
jgi:fucose permease